MFASGYQRFFGEDRNAAKLAFRSAFVPKLAAQTIESDDADWAQFWLVFDSPSDVATLLPVYAIRAMLAAQPRNVATLVRILCEHLTALLQDPDFPAAAVAPASPLAGSRGVGFLRRSASSATAPRGPDLSREALNCIRVLSHILPCIFERAGLGPPASEPILRAEGGANAGERAALDPSRFEYELLWTTEPRPNFLFDVGASDGDGRFAIDDDEDDDEHESVAGRTAAPPRDGSVTLPCLGERLLSVVIDLLFCTGFTLPIQVVTANGHRDQRVAYVIWEAGIGSTQSAGSTPDLDSNRTETMRLLLVMLSRSMYVPPGPDMPTDQASRHTEPSTSTPPATLPAEPAANAFLQQLRAWPSRRIALSVLCSLLNTAVATAPVLTVPSTAQSLSNVAASVPLVGNVLASTVSSPVAGILGRTSEGRKELAHLCILVLDVLLVDVPIDSDNVFRHYVAKLHRSADFAFLANGLLDLLSNAAAAGGAESQEAPFGLTEGLVLLWRLIDCNPKFLSAILQGQGVASRLLCSLLLISLDQRDAGAAIALIRLSAFLLQTLSAERGFASRVGGSTEASGVRGASRGRWAVPGSLSDFAIVSIYTLIFTTKGALASLYPAYTCILVNLSPYFKRLSVVASTRLSQLFLAFSTPVFLLAEEDNPRLCYNLIETFNNVIHHQFSDNPNLIYVLIRCHRRFEELAAFTLQSAVADIRKARADRERRPPLKTNASSTSLTSTPTAPSSPTAFDAIDDPFPALSEKARGKLRERTFDRDDGPPGPYSSRTGFVPTAAWVAAWREALPLDSVLVLLAELRPRVEALSAATASSATNQAALDYLRAATLLGLLPPTPALKPRRFAATSHAARWLLSVIWSVAYTRQRSVFSGTRVSLFTVQSGERPRRAEDEVAQVASRVATALQRRTSLALSETPGGRVETATV